jgi:predicted Zn-dependent protease
MRFQIDVPQGWKVENTKSVVVFAEPDGGAIVELSVVPPEQGRSPAEAAENIARQQGTQFVSGGAERINGNQAFLGIYRVETESGGIGVAAAFVSYGGHLYRTAGLAPESSFSRYSRSMNTVLRSFRELTDKRLLSVQPDRMKIYRAGKGDTLRKLAKSMGQTLPLEDLVRINRLDPDKALSAGELVKLVQSGRQ